VRGLGQRAGVSQEADALHRYGRVVTDAPKTQLDRLSPEDVEVVRQCLTAAVRGPFFPDWDFHILFGLERDDVAAVLERWPDPKCPEDQDVAVTNALNHLVHYPHGQWEVWNDFISVGPREIVRVLAQWTGKTELEVSPVLQVYNPGDPRWRIRASANLTILATDESPDVLEETVGAEPDEKWSRGDPLRAGGKRPYTGIRYRSHLDEKRAPEDHVAELVDRLRPRVQGIAAVSRRSTTYGVTFWVAEHTHAQDRQIDLEPEYLEAIAAMGARLSLDLYVYGNELE